MKMITAGAFYGAWLDTVTNRKDELLAVWRNRSAYTQLIKGMNGAIVDDMADKLGLLCYEKDYYSLDVTFYDDSDLTPGIAKGTFWFRQISVAFEHEHDFKSGLFQETSHLLLLNAGLRVLVTYPNCDPSKEMNYLHEIISGVHNAAQLSDEESFLLIFGYEKDFSWEGFVYKTDGWKQLENVECLRLHEKKAELQRIQKLKVNALERGEFEMAARLRDEERKLGAVGEKQQ